MPRFEPALCPFSACPSRHGQAPFRCHRAGFFSRLVDGRRVQRFRCRACKRRFSVQTFRLDYRLHKPQLTALVFELFVSKTTMRQIARVVGCRRRLVEHRLRLLAGHARDFHRRQLARAQARGGVTGTFQLDELETFETDRRLMPVTVPVLIERRSYFLLHVDTAPLGARGGLSPAKRKQKEALEREHGKRRSGSRRAVERTLSVLRDLLPTADLLNLQTDRKSSYRSLVRQLFAGRLGSHVRESSKRARDYGNVLFPINHTLAMMRDGISRLVRRSWAASKKRSRLELHLWIWAVYRNYIRGVTNVEPEVTPAMSIGVESRPWRRQELLRWRVFHQDQ